MPDQIEQMDRMYRYTRYVYDLSRKYYLLGRDQLIRGMDVKPCDRVLEVGCGTARILVRLNDLRSGLRLYGLDASGKMLETAETKLKSVGLAGKVILKQCLAEQLDHQATFGIDEKFDTIFFSYSLSMIPTWPDALDAAIRNIKPGRTIYIVDFWDQKDLPRWFAKLLKAWLEKFHVHYRPELIEHLQKLDAQGRGKLTLESVHRRYAYIARFKTAG